MHSLLFPRAAVDAARARLVAAAVSDVAILHPIGDAYACADD